ncbi:MAG: hypothetical protein KF744_10560 [Taibaiella sp.]|nr:hypothetical protein [Taibaiella sp.]
MKKLTCAVMIFAFAFLMSIVTKAQQRTPSAGQVKTDKYGNKERIRQFPDGRTRTDVAEAGLDFPLVSNRRDNPIVHTDTKRVDGDVIVYIKYANGETEVRKISSQSEGRDPIGREPSNSTPKSTPQPKEAPTHGNPIRNGRNEFK